MRSNPESRKFSGFLDSGTSFTGDLRFEGTLRIDGNMVGSISCPDVLVVGEAATIRADVRAGAVQVHGTIIGDVSCTHRLELCAGGRITGDIETPELVIEKGARFDGESRMGEPVAAAPADTRLDATRSERTDDAVSVAPTEEPAPATALSRTRGLRKLIGSLSLGSPRTSAPETE